MLDRAVVFEGLSAITGVPIKPLSEFQRLNPGNALPGSVSLSLQDFHISSILGYNTLDLFMSLITKLSLLFIEDDQWNSAATSEDSRNSALRKELFVNEEEFFDPRFDYDFTYDTDTAKFRRGNESYKRPKGWNRIALKVLDKYEDGNDWLGGASPGWRTRSVEGEWPVSYHGTTKEGAVGIIQSHYKAGDRQAYGRGIYSTPDIDIAESHGYTKTFKSEKTNKTYKIALQNRINPRYRKICVKKDYWLIPVPEGTSAAEEKKIVESSIRPYGLLLKEVHN